MDELDTDDDRGAKPRRRHKNWPWTVGFSLMFLATIAFGPRWWPPGPMAYCKGLAERNLVYDCKDDASPPKDSGSVTFQLSLNNKPGRLMRFSNDASYWEVRKPWADAMSKADAYTWGVGRSRTLVYVPGPIDSVTWNEFHTFFAGDGDNDFDEITRGNKLKWKGEPPEHFVRSSKCEHTLECVQDGRCSELPSHPEKGCLAGFDGDCLASVGCATEHNCAADFWLHTCAYSTERPPFPAERRARLIDASAESSDATPSLDWPLQPKALLPPGGARAPRTANP